MSSPAAELIPRARDVLYEQIRVVTLALRAPAAVVGALLMAFTLPFAITALAEGGSVGFYPEDWLIPGMAGLVLPLGVWRGVQPFGFGYMWMLPVDRRWHALARVFAGWVCLMGGVALFVIWLLGLALLSGEGILTPEVLRVLPAGAAGGVGAPVDPQQLQFVRWGPEPLFWLVPFTAATAMYSLSSALAIGVRHPLRWLLGGLLSLFLLSRVRAINGLIEQVLVGPWGLDTLLTARTESLKTEVLLTTGENVVVWHGLPDPGGWAVTTAVWTAAAWTALAAAAVRQREHRRS